MGEASLAIAPAGSWESTLLRMASEAEQQEVDQGRIPRYDHALLQRAYAYCDAITSQRSRTFYTAARLLPPLKRRAICALYSFCRRTDDIVDGGENTRVAAEERLAVWRAMATSFAPPPDELVAVAWADTRARFAIPRRCAEQLIDGVGRDLYQQRYRTFEELAAYAYGVASTVGLMSMHIIGFAGDEAIPYAVKLGVALQLTNILRDVGEDWQSGRVYLPLDELAAYGLSETDLAAGQVNDRWRAFMRFQLARTRHLYAEAQPGIALLRKDGRFAIAAASELYAAILTDIESHDYDVFHRRAHVRDWDKLRTLPGIWWRAR
jgi:15-cis-phytoene synthase